MSFDFNPPHALNKCDTLPNSDRTLITHTTRSPISPIKQRSHSHHSHNPIAYFPHQTAIAPQHSQTRSPFPHIKQRSPLNTHKPDLHFPTSNNDRLNYEYFILMLIRYNISDKFAKEGQIYD
jgi:hypothetical protein